jgi:hypothetical protein
MLLPRHALQYTMLALALVASTAREARAQAASALAGEHVRVRVAAPPEDAYARTRWEGTLVRLDADSVVLRDGRRTRAFARRRVERIDVREERRSRGAGALR